MQKKYRFSAAVLAMLAALSVTAFAQDAQEETSGEWDTDTRQEDTPWWEEDDSAAGSSEEAQEEAGEQAENDGTPRGILNSVQLDPQSANSAQLQGLVDDILADIIDEDMDTYDKVAACYDYLTENTQYGSHMRNLGATVGETTAGAIYSSYGEVEGFGAVALSAHTGMCNAYASGFLLLLQSVGIQGHLVTGQTGSARGGFAYHEWAEVDIGDVTYLFDPQLEQDLVKAGLPAYSVFFKTYDEVPGRYIRSVRKI